MVFVFARDGFQTSLWSSGAAAWTNRMKVADELDVWLNRHLIRFTPVWTQSCRLKLLFLSVLRWRGCDGPAPPCALWKHPAAALLLPDTCSLFFSSEHNVTSEWTGSHAEWEAARGRRVIIIIQRGINNNSFHLTRHLFVVDGCRSAVSCCTLACPGIRCD